MSISVPIFVIHVRGNKERENHITNELHKNAIPFSFILEGNPEDITIGILEKYFTGFMKAIKPVTSCALKHFIAYERIIANNYPFSLILEDDIVLAENFTAILEKSLKEIRNKSLKNILVSFEHSDLKYVKASQIQRGQYLYQEKQGRCTGAYLVDLSAAKAIIEHIYYFKCGSPIDWLHNNLAKDEIIYIFWCHPTIAEQKSHNGTMQSLINVKKRNFVKKLTYHFNKFYKQILYKLR